MKFFNPEGEEISKEEFISFYNENYFIGSKLSKVVKNSKCTENVIENILKEGMKTEEDVVKMLAWKIGKIKHKNSYKAGDFVYAKDWSGAGKKPIDYKDIKRYGRVFDLKGFVTFILDNADRLHNEATANHNPQRVLDELKERSPKGIGTVYLITVLYFISRGEYPIYDRFALQALNAIISDEMPGGQVEFSKLHEKKSRKFSNVMDCYNKDYFDKMKDVFGNEYNNKRDIDRALWVYGHLFNAQKKS